VIEGKTGMSVTLTEPEGGSDLANLTTTAVKTPDGKHYVVNGAKKFITGGLTSHYFSTLVRTGTAQSGYLGTSLLLITKDMPGVEVHKLYTQGWWSGNTTRVVFNNVLVPVENLIGKENMGFSYMVDVMNHERMIAIFGAIRGCRGSISTAVEYARERVTFGKRLIDHQTIRHKIAHMIKSTEACQAMVEHISFQIECGAKPKEIGGQVALLKVQSTQALEYCIREASQVLGGAAFLRSGKGQYLERAVREVRVATVGGGSEEIMLDLAMRMAKL
jgi:alkylation response protein AidB-like acyl-CoA dehydrogenase